jgi:hypothetical protein
MSRLRARDTGAKQERRAGDVTRRGGPARNYAGVPTVFMQHTCVSRGSSTREQEDREVRGGVGIANQSSSIVSSQGSTTSNSSYPSLIAQPTTATTDHREEYPSGYSSPTTIPWQASSSPTEPRHHRALLITDPVRHGNSLSTILLHNQSYPKVCPDPLNLPNAGDSYAGTSSLSSYSLSSPTRDLIALI